MIEIAIAIAGVLVLGVAFLWLRARAGGRTGPAKKAARPLAERLAAGEPGLRWTPPASWRHDGENATVLQLVDEQQGNVWQVAVVPYGLDLSEDQDDLLRADIERQVRASFVSDTPRTREPSWSPLVSVERVEVDRAPALSTIYRASYAPGDELVVGQLMIPLAEGLAEINVTARAAMTGLREVAAFERAMASREDDGDSGIDALPDMTQQQVDDAELDGELDPLGQVRRALRWLVTDADLTVSRPAEPQAAPLTLAWAGCSVVPPARYAAAAADFPRSDTMDVLTRVGLGSEGVRMIDVYRAPATNLEPGDTQALEQLARENAAGWAAEGAGDIRCTVTPVDLGDDRTHLGNHVQFEAHGSAVQTYAHWFTDLDGAVFRVGAHGPEHVPIDELIDDTRVTVESLRRLDD